MSERFIFSKKLLIILLQATISNILEIREIWRPQALFLPLPCENNPTTSDTVIIHRRQHRCRTQQHHSHSSASLSSIYHSRFPFLELTNLSNLIKLVLYFYRDFNFTISLPIIYHCLHFILFHTHPREIQWSKWIEQDFKTGKLECAHVGSIPPSFYSCKQLWHTSRPDHKGRIQVCVRTRLPDKNCLLTSGVLVSEQFFFKAEYSIIGQIPKNKWSWFWWQSYCCINWLPSIS